MREWHEAWADALFRSAAYPPKQARPRFFLPLASFQAPLLFSSCLGSFTGSRKSVDLWRLAARDCLLVRLSSGMQSRIAVIWLFPPQSQQPVWKGRSERSATAKARHFPLQSFSARLWVKPVPRRRRPPLPVAEIPRRPCSVLGPRKPRSNSQASEGPALRRAALWNTEFNRMLGRERISDQACV